MDPDFVYELMVKAWAAGNTGQAHLHADTLRIWLAGGGFAPRADDSRAVISTIYKHTFNEDCDCAQCDERKVIAKLDSQ